MIVRILNEGQYELPAEELVDLNKFDDALEKALEAGNEVQLQATLRALLQQVRSRGTHLPDADIEDSDLILPAQDSTLEELRQALGSDGLLPG